MTANKIKEMALFEHGFWLQILGDHSRFILNALSPKETDFIEKANEFIDLFDSLLKKSHKLSSVESLEEFNYQAYSSAMKIREFKLIIIAKMIEDKISINMSPTFVNHMVNELEEYICILNGLINGNIQNTSDIHLHLLWLLDGAGHASIISSNLDITEKELIKKSHMYSKIFTDLYLKAIEYNGYTRTNIRDFPALRNLNTNADNTMTSFKKFLKELKEDIIDKKVLGSIYPLMTDHMIREECYYLTKLYMVSDTKNPECDPTKPRIEI